MGFNSIAFLVFAPLAVAGNWLLRGRALRLWMVAASYVFYGWARPWYCLLLLASTVLDFGVGLGLERVRSGGRRRALLAASLIGNLGLLAAFKYAGLIAQTLNDVLGWLGAGPGVGVPDVPLPVGISFYTFQTLSYTIDVYRGRVAATRSFTTFALYVAFFPQLVAGPIERAGHLLHQLAERRDRTQDDLLRGTSRILWGLLKKVVFADSLAVYVDQVYNGLDAATPATLLLAIYAFTFQIYLDFSAYSDIAIGLARTMGVHLRENFRWPYLARSPGEYWQRWHISLSTWMRDYVYFPLGGSRRGHARTLFNVAVVFGLAGLWHGASWKFVLWGLYIAATVGMMILYGRLRGRGVDTRPERPFALSDLPAVLVTFHVFCVSKVVFRAASLEEAARVLGGLWGDWTGALWPAGAEEAAWRAVAFTAMAVVAHVLRGLGLGSSVARREVPALGHGAFWAAAALAVLLFYPDRASQFIYFQF